jgi:OOP family OmpA-OmpF porin
LNTHCIAALAFLAALGAPAHAHEPYVGLSLATPGEARLRIGPNATAANDNNPTALKFYAGLPLSTHWSVELGYGAFGSWHFSDPTPGSSDQAQIGSRALTLAAKVSWPLGERFSLHGKLGLAHNRFSYSDTLGQRERDSFTRPLWGVGAELKLSEHLSLPLDFEYLGKADTRFGRFQQQKLEIGLRYRF